jgi:hypothetical protein
LSARAAPVVLLGPQRAHPHVGAVLEEVGARGDVALITAGWQEWEDDDARLRESMGRRGVNLHLYGRAEIVWRQDPELAAAHHALQRQVRLLRRAYNVRLARAMDACIELDRLEGDPEVLDRERADALEVVRALDRHHAERLEALRRAFDDRYRPYGREAVARHRDEVRRILDGVDAVVVEGGHVPVLLNRLRLFGLDELLGSRTVVACSGGAMALSAQVVLFHDSPPWGPGHAEVGEVGLGLHQGLVPLPRGSERLRLDDPARVARMARRFAPTPCVVLDEGTRVSRSSGVWTARGALTLEPSGEVRPWDDPT